MFNPLDLSGRTIFVSGASSGIGREVSIVLSKLGAKLIINGRDLERLESTRCLLMGTGHRAIAQDLAVLDDIPSWFKDIAIEVGGIFGLVHCAGIQKIQPLANISISDTLHCLNLNCAVPLMLCRALRQKGVRKDSGSIVLMSSVMGLVGLKAGSVYSSSKGALQAACRSLALELANDAIRINCVAPAYVETEMFEKIKQTLSPEQVNALTMLHPLGIGTPSDVANAVAFLLSDASRWITGTTLVVDGGYSAR